MSTFTCVGFLFFMECQMPAPPPPAVICPPVRQWSGEFQKRAAAELRNLPPGSAVGTIVVQSIGDRDIARACKKRTR